MIIMIMMIMMIIMIEPRGAHALPQREVVPHLARRDEREAGKEQYYHYQYCYYYYH